jgi:PAS domain-containing protein
MRIAEQGIMYLLPYLLSALFPLWLAFFVRQRNRSPVGITFFALLFMQALWSLAALLEIISGSLAGKIFFDDLEYLAVGLVAVLALSFSRRYEGVWFRHGKTTWWFLFIFPATTFIFAITSPLHGLHRADASIDAAVPFGELLYTFRLPMLLLLVPVYFISLLGIFRLFLHALRVRGSRRMGALCAGAGLMLPLVGTVLTIAKIRINGRYESSSLWLVAGDLLIAVGIFRFRIAGVLPAARQNIVDNLRDPVIVIDQDGIVVDHNDAFSRVMDLPFKNLNGRAAKDVFSSIPRWKEGIGNFT